MDYKDLTIQEQEVISRLRKMSPFERIEIMKDESGYLGNDLVMYRASRERITPNGKVVGVMVKSIITKFD